MSKKHSGHFKMKNTVKLWLFSVTLMVLIMVAVGGLTRLTNSGLSMVEWKPITGILPPLNDAEWREEFSKYQNSPEFIQLNKQMNIDGFKKIYWLEYIHRILARLTGLIFFIPLIFFLYNGCLEQKTKKTLVIVSLLGICQGFMGWYMVKSGLIDIPYVNHFKLTFHLLFALFIYIIVFNEALRLYLKNLYVKKMSNLWIIILIVAIAQISLGGLTAGLDAGTIYNEFPLMGGSIIPNELFSSNISLFLNDPAIVQFLHRSLAYILLFIISYASIKLHNYRQYTLSIILMLSVLTQVFLGIATLLTHVSITLASLHQIFAFILIGIVLLISRITRI